jgi:hypothetical protein
MGIGVRKSQADLDGRRIEAWVFAACMSKTTPYDSWQQCLTISDNFDALEHIVTKTD